MRRSTIQATFVAAALLFLASCGGALPGGGTGGTGMPSGTGGNRSTGLGNFGGGSNGAGGIGTGGGMQCGAVETTIVPADVLIVLDASAAMNDDSSDNPCSGGCGASSKWAWTVSAIERLVSDTEMTVNWGIQIFPDPGTACAVAGGVTVPVGPAHAGAIATAMRARTSSNGGVIAGANAPIRGAENVASTYLATLTDVGRKFILLATAGAPSCLPGSSDLGAGDAAGAVAAIVNASNAGFPTSVLGIATTGGIAEMTLNEMALSGNLAQMGSPSYTPVANIADASSGLRTLLGINPPCVVALPPGIGGPLTGSEIGVRVDGTYIPRDGAHLNGWDYVDPALTSIEVYGPACETLLLGPPHTVSILLRCPVP